MNPPMDEDGRLKTEVGDRSYAEALSRNIKPVGTNILKQPAVGCSVQKCMRCGNGGHAHEGCTSKKPIWGKDWKKHRERRKHMRRPMRKYEGDVGAKAHQSVCMVRQPAMLKAAVAALCSSTDWDRHQPDVIDAAMSGKRLHAEAAAEMKTPARVGEESGCSVDLGKVLVDLLEVCYNHSRGKDVSGAGATKRAGIAGCLKEVEEPMEHQPGLRRLQEVGQLKEVAQVGVALDVESATRRTVPDS